MEPILRNIENFDWITILLLFGVVLLVLAKSTFPVRFLNFIILPFNNKYIFMYNKKEKLFNWFQIFFTVFQIINFSLFIYLATKVLFPDTHNILSDEQFYFPLILLCLFAFLLIKVGIQLSNGFIFNSNKFITELLFKKLSYLNYSSLIMFVANIILTYIANDSKTIVFLAIFLILLVNIIGWVRLLRNYQKFIASNLFYFIVYLCALEIAPFVLIGSYLND